VIDQGQGRNLRQTLEIDGGYADPTNAAGAVEWMYRMIHRLERSQPTEYKPSVLQLLEILEAHPHVVDSLEPARALHPVWSTAQVNQAFSRGQLAAYHYAMASADPGRADEFFASLATGADLSVGDPAYALRERFNADQLRPKEKQLTKVERISFLVQAWEATRAGEQMSAKHLKFIRSGAKAQEITSVRGVDWLGTVAEPESEPEAEGAQA